MAKNEVKEVIKRVSEDKASLEFFEEFASDERVVMAAVKQDGKQLKFATEELRNDKKIVTQAIENNKEALRHAGDDIRNNKPFMFNLIKKDKGYAKYLGSELRTSHDFLISTMEKLGKEFLEFIADEMKDDKAFMLEAIKLDKHALAYASNRLKEDKDVVLASIRWGGTEEHIGERLRNDESFISEMFEKNLVFPDTPLDWLGEKIRSSKDFMLDHVPDRPYLFQYAADALKMNRSFILQFDAPYLSRILPHIDEELQAEPAFLTEAAKKDPEVLNRISDKKVKKEVKKALKGK